MHVDLPLVVVSTLVGALVGLSGVGAGALLTPALMFFFSVRASVAVTTDLVAALFIRPVAVAVHWRAGHLNVELVRYLCYGSVPGALVGTFVAHEIGPSWRAERALTAALAVALVVGATALLARSVTTPAPETGDDPPVRRLATVTVGALGGVMVGATSVGAGSLIVALLVVLYPTLSGRRLVGSDLAQSVPLTVAAALGSLFFGHLDATLTAQVVAGSLPGAIAGSLWSRRVKGTWLRRIIAATVLATGLRYLVTAAGPVVALSVALVGSIALTFAFAIRWRRRADASVPKAV